MLLIVTTAFIVAYALIVRYTFELSMSWIDKRGWFVWLVAVVVLLGISTSLVGSLDHLWLVLVNQVADGFRLGHIVSSITIGVSFLVFLVMTWVDADLVTRISEARPVVHSILLSIALLVLAFKRFLTTVVVAE